MEQPENLIAEIRAHRLREQRAKLLVADAENRRLRVAAILSEWARKTMTEYGPATTQRAAPEQDEQSRPADEEISPPEARRASL